MSFLGDLAGMSVRIANIVENMMAPVIVSEPDFYLSPSKSGMFRMPSRLRSVAQQS
jgi:hypothetical protein